MRIYFHFPISTQTLTISEFKCTDCHIDSLTLNKTTYLSNKYVAKKCTCQCIVGRKKNE